MKNTHDNIMILVDCFTGADGGVSFVKTRQFLENLDPKQSEEAYQMLLALDRLAKLITILERS